MNICAIHNQISFQFLVLLPEKSHSRYIVTKCSYTCCSYYFDAADLVIVGFGVQELVQLEALEAQEELDLQEALVALVELEALVALAVQEALEALAAQEELDPQEALVALVELEALVALAVQEALEALVEQEIQEVCRLT